MPCPGSQDRVVGTTEDPQAPLEAQNYIGPDVLYGTLLWC